MKKKLIIFALSLCMVAGLSGCQKKYVTLGDYKGLALTKVSATVTDEELQDEIDMSLSDNATEEEITNRAAKDGDTITMDFDGTIDGTAFEGGSATDYDLVLGSGDFIEGFEEQLIDTKTGDKKDVKVTFPDDYDDGTLSGKEAVFAVTVKSIKQITPAVYDDAFVASISDFKTTADYEENLKNELLASKEEDSEYTLKEDAIIAVVSNSTFNGYPDDLYKKKEEEINQNNQYYAELFGVSVDELAGSAEDVKQSVLSAVNEQLVLDAIGKKEKISVSEEEYTKYVNENLDNYEVASLEEFEQNYDKDSTKTEILRDKICQFLVDNATVTDVTEDEKYGEDGEEFPMGDETDPPLETGAQTEAPSETAGN